MCARARCFFSDVRRLGDGLAGSDAFSSARRSRPGHAQIRTSTACLPITSLLQKRRNKQTSDLIIHSRFASEEIHHSRTNGTAQNEDSNQQPSLALQGEDDLDGSSVEAADAAREAHELVEVGDPLRARLRLLVRDEHALSPRVRVLVVLSEFVVHSQQMLRGRVVCATNKILGLNRCTHGLRSVGCGRSASALTKGQQIMWVATVSST